jgi:copper chaperone
MVLSSTEVSSGTGKGTRSESAADPKGDFMSTATTTTVTVVGMTCGHCASSVREEVGAIAGVTDVDIDVKSGRVTVDSTAPVDRNSIKSAVEEAGYGLTD